MSKVYREVKDLLASLGGTMIWKSGGSGGGGVWVLTLRGRTQRVEFRERTANRLDELYVPKVQNPVVSNDYSDNLVDDAVWLLIAMFI